MKLTKSGPLIDREIDWLEEVLLKYGNDDSVLCFSELDGFLTAIVSGPNTISPNTWLSAIWGRGDYHPRWTTEKEMTRFVGLCFQHMNDIAGCLYDAPELFEPIFNEREVKGEKYTIVEEWCFGYMKGKSLDDWSGLPGELRPSLEVIALHGVEKNFPVLEKMTGEQFEERLIGVGLCRGWCRLRALNHGRGHRLRRNSPAAGTGFVGDFCRQFRWF